MIYTPLTKKAIKLCFDNHKDQVDKCGLPYVFHPFHVAESMKDEYTTCVALLHDIVEDTNITLENLRDYGFPNEIINAIGLLTHEESVPYFDYVRMIKTNPIAKVVKIADLKHNSDLSRLDIITDEDIKRKVKYETSLQMLE